MPDIDLWCCLRNSESNSRENALTETLDPWIQAVEARAALASGGLTAQSFVEASIAQIERINPAVNALVIDNFKAAREQARTLDEQASGGVPQGALHGLPVAIKDIQSIAGLPTTWGSVELRDAQAETDSPIVARIRRAGGVLLGKTNVPEKSIGANTVNPLFGATGNPYAPELTCGGSSGGSAVAVATAMVPLATGSDHGGSLRIPACFSGVVGMRPTPGMVPNEQRTFPHTNYAVQGPMARSVRDVALLLSVIAERDTQSRQDPMVFPFDVTQFADPPRTELSAMRVGYSEDLGGVMVSEAVRAEFRARIELLRPLVRSCAPCAVDLRTAPAVDWHLRQELFAATYAQEAEHWDDLVNPNLRATYESAITTPMQDIAKAKKQQLELSRHMAEQYSDYDVVISPGVSIPPFPWRQLNPSHIDGKPVATYMAWLELTAALTVVGHPVVALPCGLDARGLPFGIQVVGRAFEDCELLSNAIALEDAFAQDDRLCAPRPDESWLAGQDVGCRDDGRQVQAQYTGKAQR